MPGVGCQGGHVSVSSPGLACVGCACAFIGKAKAGAAGKSGGLRSGMVYQLGVGSMLIHAEVHVKVGSIRDEYVSAVCFASEHQAGPDGESGTHGQVKGPRIWAGGPCWYSRDVQSHMCL